MFLYTFLCVVYWSLYFYMFYICVYMLYIYIYMYNFHISLPMFLIAFDTFFQVYDTCCVPFTHVYIFLICLIYFSSGFVHCLITSLFIEWIIHSYNMFVFVLLFLYFLRVYLNCFHICQFVIEYHYLCWCHLIRFQCCSSFLKIILAKSFIFYCVCDVSNMFSIIFDSKSLSDLFLICICLIVAIYVWLFFLIRFSYLLDAYYHCFDIGSTHLAWPHVSFDVLMYMFSNVLLWLCPRYPWPPLCAARWKRRQPWSLLVWDWGRHTSVRTYVERRIERVPLPPRRQCAPLLQWWAQTWLLL